MASVQIVENDAIKKKENSAEKREETRRLLSQVSPTNYHSRVSQFSLLRSLLFGCLEQATAHAHPTAWSGLLKDVSTNARILLSSL